MASGLGLQIAIREPLPNYSDTLFHIHYAWNLSPNCRKLHRTVLAFIDGRAKEPLRFWIDSALDVAEDYRSKLEADPAAGQLNLQLEAVTKRIELLSSIKDKDGVLLPAAMFLFRAVNSTHDRMHRESYASEESLHQAAHRAIGATGALAFREVLPWTR